MNVENILRVADAIEKHEISDLGFNMAEIWTSATKNIPDMTGHKCSTVACIVGWAEAVENPRLAYGHWSRSDLEDFFEIDGDTSEELACPVDYELGLYTPAQAVRTLRHLAETGVVDWNLPETTP